MGLWRVLRGHRPDPSDWVGRHLRLVGVQPDGGDELLDPAGKPIGAACIAPATVAKALEGTDTRASLTIGSDAGTAEAIEAILAEVARLQAGGMTTEEIGEARDSLIGRFQMALETPARVASQWWYLTVWDLPERWYSDYQRSITKTKDAAALDAAAKRLLDPSRLVIVVVADRSKTEAELSKIAPVQVVDAQ